MIGRILLGILALLAIGCEVATKPVAPPGPGNALVVVTINSPATWYEDSQGHAAGFEYDLVDLFAKELDVPLQVEVVASPEAAEKALAGRKAHLAAARNSPKK